MRLNRGNSLHLLSGILFVIASFLFFLAVLRGAAYFDLIPAFVFLIFGAIKIIQAFPGPVTQLQATDIKVELIKREDYNK